ncbi:MAG: acyl-CoA thioesterase [Deltaproteobacteria bacterium]|nr:acyl-CoA thioesterase [Deltaproteobacteria bacterium]
MLTHRTKNRVIYGDTDKMGYAYNANYLRWFEIGRSEMFRSMGLSYKTIETRGIFLPVSEAYCKFLTPIQYDDMLVIETSLDTGVKGGMKFDYCIKSEDSSNTHAKGYTKHAFMDKNGRVVRPPDFIKELIDQNKDDT